METTRITIDIPKDMADNLNEYLKTHGLQLRGKYGCSKLFFGTMVESTIKKDLLYPYIKAVVNKTGRGKM